jgi:N-methylhydantoinase A
MRLATDAGGTFTDLVAFDETTGEIMLGKALTTPRDTALGVLDTIRQASELGLGVEAATFFVHGGTTVINAITERKGVRTALVTTRGFRDVLAIGRGNRPDLYNLHATSPEPFVPRHLRFEVAERIDARGAVRQPLDMAELAAIVDALRAAEVAAVAVTFLHAYANPAHEAAAASYLRERLDGTSVTASHEISRQWREYERTSSTVLSAYVQPIVARYLANLDAALRREGFACPFYAMQSNGGLTSFAAAAAAPLALVESGPAGGVAGTARIGEALGESEVLYFDVGGTTAKCSLITGARPALKPDYRLEWTRLSPGYPVQIPVVDIVEIGAGGGSIAWVDAGGSLRVGPVSAGAEPGPACYGRGGTLATVTDAKLVTGVLDAERFAAGRLPLDMGLARAALAPMATHLGASVEEAANAIIGLAEANMINALKLVTVQRGHDPRDMVLVACGGGGPMHAAVLGRELGVKQVVIPRYAGLFSAWGMLAALPRVDLRRTRLTPAREDALEIARAIFAELEAAAATHFGKPTPAGLLLHHSIDIRYAGQEHTVATVIDGSVTTLAALLERFHAAHERAYTFSLPDTSAELVAFHLAAEVEAARIALPVLAAGGRRIDNAVRGRRLVHFPDASRPRPTVVYDRDRLPPGAALAGPALIEEDTSTTVVLPGQRLTVERHGLLVIDEAP